jgi:hypothetical protein
MSAQSVTLDAAQSVDVQQVGGDLVVQGWDKAELEARGDGVHVERRDNLVKVSSRGDLVLSIPRGAAIEIGTVGGDVRVEDLDEAVTLSVIGGDVVLRNLTGQVSLQGPVGGDTRFENVAQVSVAGGQFSQHSRRAAEEVHRRLDRQQRRTEERLRQAEKKMERVRARSGVDFGSWPGRRWSASPISAQANEQVSDEERMTILKMLAEKKITSAQADTLLAALEGEPKSPPASGVSPEEAGS